MLFLGPAVDDFWTIWSKNAEAGLFRAFSLAGGPTDAGSSAFLGQSVCYGFVAGVWEAELGDDVDVHC